MTEPLISVIIPVYNQEKYVEKCVLSIEEQTYRKIEIILINDGSTDSSGEICSRLYTEYKNIHYIQQTNKGVSQARNIGIKNASGDYVMFVDPDDYLHEDIIRILWGEMNRNPDVDIVMASAYSCLGENKEVCHFFEQSLVCDDAFGKEKLFLQVLNPNMYQRGGAKGCSSTAPWGKIYRKSLFESNHLTFNTVLSRMQDNVFNMWCFVYARKIVYLDIPLYYYNREHIKAIKAYDPILLESILAERDNFTRSCPQYMTEKVLLEKHNETCRFLKFAIEYVCDREKLKDCSEKIKNVCNYPAYRNAIYDEQYPKTKLMKIISYAYKNDSMWIVAIIYKVYYSFFFEIRKKLNGS